LKEKAVEESVELSLSDYLRKLFSVPPVGASIAQEIKRLEGLMSRMAENEPDWERSGECEKLSRRRALLRSLAEKIAQEKAHVISHNARQWQGPPTVTEGTFSEFLRLLMECQVQLHRGMIGKLDQKTAERVPAERKLALLPPFQALWLEIEDNTAMLCDKAMQESLRRIYDTRIVAYYYIFVVYLIESFPSFGEAILENRYMPYIDENWVVHLEIWS
jgi:hypothetical protein